MLIGLITAALVAIAFAITAFILYGKLRVASELASKRADEASAAEQSKRAIEDKYRSVIDTDAERDRILSGAEQNRCQVDGDYSKGERITRSFEAINKMGQANACSVNQRYLRLKADKLRLTHEYQLKRH